MNRRWIFVPGLALCLVAVVVWRAIEAERPPADPRPARSHPPPEVAGLPMDAADPAVLAPWLTLATRETEDPAAAWERLQAELAAQPVEELRRLAQALRHISARDEREGLFRAVVRAWSGLEPEAAAAWALGVPDPQLRSWSLIAATEAWTRQDAAGVLQWSQRLNAEDERSVLLVSGTQLARERPEAFAVWQGVLPEGEARQRLLWQAALHWANRDALSLMEHLHRDSASVANDWHEEALVAVATELSRSDPAMAVRLIEETPRTPRAQVHALESALVTWFTMNPEVATGAWSQLQNEGLRVAGAEALARLWLTRDRAAALAWIEKLPLGPVQDAALVQAIASLPAEQRKSGRAYLERISGAEARTRAQGLLEGS